MTLTNGDLKSIASVFDQKFEEKGVATKTDLKDFAKKSDLKKLATKNDLQKLDKKFDKLFDYLDKDYLKVKRDVREIQSHLRLPISDF